MTPKIGAFVLESLTTGMYTDPLDAIREYVQNAVDSIRSAEREGLIKKGHGRIEIALDTRARTVYIKDNGGGVREKEILAKLIDIGMSDKDIEVDAGFRGIGRLAGIAYCDSLSFRTSTFGEACTSEVTLNCKAIRQSVSPAVGRAVELHDVVDSNSRVAKYPEDTKVHFFEVCLQGVSEAAEAFLDSTILENYLGQVAPVEFDAQKFVFAPKIYEWLSERGIELPSVTIVIRGSNPPIERQVFKPHRTHYRSRRTRAGEFDIQIKDIAFYPANADANSPYWIWYSISDLLGMIDDDRVAGFRIRKNNIALGGPERMAEVFSRVAESNNRFNAYYVGEVHVLSPEAIPNARRDGIEDSKAWTDIREELVSFARERSEEVRLTSEARNRPTEKIVISAEKVVREIEESLKGGLVSDEERNALLTKAIQEENRVQKALAAERKKDDAQRISKAARKVQGIRERLEQTEEYAVEKVRSSLDRKQRKVLKEVLQILYDSMQSLECSNRGSCYKRLKAEILEHFQANESGTTDE